MAKIADILSLMRAFAPESETEPGFDDSVGLLVGSENGDTAGALLCLDCTERVIAEAAEKGYSLVISHHPAIFRGIKKVTDETPTGRMILAAAKRGVSVYSAHTNLDFCEGGINDYAAELLGLSNVRPLLTEGTVAVGRTGELAESMTAARLAARCAAVFNDSRAAVAGDADKKVKTVAVLCGGGGDIGFLEAAAAGGADCYITGDVPHHVALYAAESGTPIVIVQHYAAERIYIKRLGEVLARLAGERGVAARFEASESERDPICKEDA
ncbi:MAG TPA: Nif3-like dinuclear metal center hexameric protein [Candidatus Protoclostridium stercorigallinarum]|uniref:GTP cyclohydrolase 1 type 2 homolog n=1 Tax=Candidatus Protoclostridium stercorigallinarum TaxID=2838741 RepID=A0A9D1PZ11_9FIRM|nr:Nif3-like dinuclear metal center hexameric protein [Candidatus Protoclostridium stercorigallinarum]